MPVPVGSAAARRSCCAVAEVGGAPRAVRALGIAAVEMLDSEADLDGRTNSSKAALMSASVAAEM